MKRPDQPKFSKERLYELAEHENIGIAICARGLLKHDYDEEYEEPLQTQE